MRTIALIFAVIAFGLAFLGLIVARCSPREGAEPAALAIVCLILGAVALLIAFLLALLL